MMQIKLLAAAALVVMLAMGEAEADAQQQSSGVIQSAAVEVSRAPYQATLSTTCPFGATCFFYSDVVENNRRLEVHHVSCTAHNDEETSLFKADAALVKADNLFLQYLHILEGSIRRYAAASEFDVSQQIFLFVPAKRRLRLMVQANLGSMSLTNSHCYISGYMVKLQAL
jgi:hypothetical protein